MQFYTIFAQRYSDMQLGSLFSKITIFASIRQTSDLQCWHYRFAKISASDFSQSYGNVHKHRAPYYITTVQTNYSIWIVSINNHAKLKLLYVYYGVALLFYCCF